WRGLPLSAPLRRGVLLRLRLSRAAAVPAWRGSQHGDSRDHPCNDGSQRVDAAAWRGQRRRHGLGRRCLAEGPDRERAGMAARLAAGRLVSAARGVVATRRREAAARVSGAAVSATPSYARAWAMIAAAFAALSRTLFHSPAASQSLGTIHEPPMQSTFGCARNSPALASLMPPVGQSFSPASGPARPLSIASPPTALAGNSLQQRKPCAISCRNSVGVAPPGTAGIDAR